MAIDVENKITLTLPQVVELYGLSVSTWRRFVHEGRLPGYRPKNAASILVKRSDVERFLFSNPVTEKAAIRDGRRGGKRTGRPRKTAQA